MRDRPSLYRYTLAYSTVYTHVYITVSLPTVALYTHTHAHINTHTHTHTCTHAHTYTGTNLHDTLLCIYTYIYTCIHLHTAVSLPTDDMDDRTPPLPGRLSTGKCGCVAVCCRCVAGVLQCVAMSHELFVYRVAVWELPSSAMLALVNVSVLQCVSLCCSVSRTVYSYNAIKRLQHRQVSFIGLICVYMGLIRVYIGLF